MAARKIELGPTGEQVRQRVAELRERRGLTLAELSYRLTHLGHPIAAQGISRIEQGERRVDTDDLIALAAALNVSPLGLLLPQEGFTLEFPTTLVTEAFLAQCEEAWRWGVGLAPLPLVFADRRDDVLSDRGRVREFQDASFLIGVKSLIVEALNDTEEGALADVARHAAPPPDSAAPTAAELWARASQTEAVAQQALDSANRAVAQLGQMAALLLERWNQSLASPEGRERLLQVLMAEPQRTVGGPAADDPSAKD